MSSKFSLLLTKLVDPIEIGKQVTADWNVSTSNYILSIYKKVN